MSNDPSPILKPGLSRVRRFMSLLFKIVLPIVVLTAAGLGAKQMLETAPKAPRRHRARMPKLVEVTTLNAAVHAVELEAMGQVIPARSVELKPEVAGRVTWIARTLEPGARFRFGEPLLKIDRRDFELAVTQRKSEVDQAEAAVIEARYSLTKAGTDLKLEMGNQAVALSLRELAVVVNPRVVRAVQLGPNRPVDSGVARNVFGFFVL